MSAFDSSQFGYLQPQDTSLEDDALVDFLHDLVVGTTGIDTELVFPRWQPEDPNAPDFGTDWAAIGESERSRDTNTFKSHENDTDVVSRNEILSILVSFYGPNAQRNSNRLAMGLQIGQNREQLLLNGYGLVDLANPIITSDLQHEKWVPRIDQPFRIRRAVTYTYPVRDLLGAKIESGDTTIVTTKTQLPMFAWGPAGDFVAGWGTGNWITD